MVTDLNTFAHKEFKLPQQKEEKYTDFLSFVNSVKTSYCPHFLKSNVQTFFLEDKVMYRSGLRFENFCLCRVLNCCAIFDYFFIFIYIFFFSKFCLTSYYPQWSRNSLSPVNENLFNQLKKLSGLIFFGKVLL